MEYVAPLWRVEADNQTTISMSDYEFSLFPSLFKKIFCESLPLKRARGDLFVPRHQFVIVADFHSFYPAAHMSRARQRSLYGPCVRRADSCALTPRYGPAETSEHGGSFLSRPNTGARQFFPGRTRTCFS